MLPNVLSKSCQTVEASKIGHVSPIWQACRLHLSAEDEFEASLLRMYGTFGRKSFGTHSDFNDELRRIITKETIHKVHIWYSPATSIPYALFGHSVQIEGKWFAVVVLVGKSVNLPLCRNYIVVWRSQLSALNVEN